MSGDRNLSYSEVLAFVRTYTTEDSHYDVNGVVHLLLAALDNLSSHRVEADFEQIDYSVTDKQRQLLIDIGHFLETFTPESELSEAIQFVSGELH